MLRSSGPSTPHRLRHRRPPTLARDGSRDPSRGPPRRDPSRGPPRRDHPARSPPRSASQAQEPKTDLDRFIERNRPSWERLGELLARAGRHPQRLSTDELDEVVRLHLRTSSHLATLRTVHPHDAPQLAGHLSSLVGRSAALVHGSRAGGWPSVVRAVRDTFPAAVWHARWQIAASALVFLVAWALVAGWLATTPAAYEAAMPPAAREAFLERDFEAYYSAEPGATFAARVFTNNAAVGALAFGTGIAFGVPTILVLLLNAVNVGVATGMFHAAGDAARFWGLLLPHGLLELTAVFVAAGGGLRLGWTVIDPGDRTRPRALADEGRRTVVIVLGLVAVFGVAAVIEAFVTPAPWPTWARVGTGALALAAFCAYIAVFGHRAAARGLTGALGEEPATRRVPRPAVSDQSPPAALTSR